MKALSLHEPWASAMALGKKRNETRGHRIHYRGDIAICAAKREIDNWIPVTLLEVELATWQPAYGCVVCVVEVYDCKATDLFNLGEPIDPVERLLGDYQFGRFAWLTRNLRRLREPVPVVGKQGLFNLPPEVEAAVRAQR